MRRVFGVGCLVVAVLAPACSQSDAGITSREDADGCGRPGESPCNRRRHGQPGRDAVRIRGSAQARARAVGLARNTGGVESVIDNLVISSEQRDHGVGSGYSKAWAGLAARRVRRKPRAELPPSRSTKPNAWQGTLWTRPALPQKVEAVVTDAADRRGQGKLLADADVSGEDRRRHEGRGGDTRRRRALHGGTGSSGHDRPRNKQRAIGRRPDARRTLAAEKQGRSSWTRRHNREPGPKDLAY